MARVQAMTVLSTLPSNDADASILVTQECTLHKFPPEMRKEIFNAILDLFFETFPERKEIRYTVTESGELCRIFVQKGKNERQDAGSSLGLLPDIELALLPDTALLREFQTTRLERSILTLVPDWAYNAEGATQTFVSWPCVNFDAPDDPICWLRSLTDIYDRMGRLCRNIRKLVAKAPRSEYSTSSHVPKSFRLRLPRLRKLTIQFPDATRYGNYACYKLFEKDHVKLWSGLKMLLQHTQLTSIEFQDLRDRNVPQELPEYDLLPRSFGLIGEKSPYFGIFSTGLSEILGIKPQEQTRFYRTNTKAGDDWNKIHHCHCFDSCECLGKCDCYVDFCEHCQCMCECYAGGRYSPDFGIYQAMATWTAEKGKYLVWNSDI